MFVLWLQTGIFLPDTIRLQQEATRPHSCSQVLSAGVLSTSGAGLRFLQCSSRLDDIAGSCDSVCSGGPCGAVLSQPQLTLTGRMKTPDQSFSWFSSIFLPLKRDYGSSDSTPAHLGPGSGNRSSCLSVSSLNYNMDHVTPVSTC